jgi:flagellar assembly factor FliW
MKLQTIQFGEVDYTEDLIINFSSGLLGFENLKKYLLIKTENDIFYWLYSIEQPEIAFPLIGAAVLDENYPRISDFEPFGIVTLNKDPLKVTVNLKAPVYINQETKNGNQKILEEPSYEVNFNLFIE